MSDAHAEAQRVRQVLRDLNLPAGQYVVSGSATMVLRGIERPQPIGDLDLFVSTRLWFDLMLHNPGSWGLIVQDPSDPKRRCDPPYLSYDIGGLRVDVFFSWRWRGMGDRNVAYLIESAEMVGSVPCLSLEMLRGWKQELGRAKDANDVWLISKRLAELGGA